MITFPVSSPQNDTYHDLPYDVSRSNSQCRLAFTPLQSKHVQIQQPFSIRAFALLINSFLFLSFGSVYTFPQFFPTVKTLLHFSETDLNFAGTGFYVGSNVIGYFIAPKIINRFGTAVAFGIGGILSPIAWTGVGLVMLYDLRVNPIEFASLFCLMGISNGFVFASITQFMISLLPPEHTAFCVALPCMMHAFGGFICSICFNILPEETFYKIVVGSQCLMWSLNLTLIQCLLPKRARGHAQSNHAHEVVLYDEADADLSSKHMLWKLTHSFSFYLVAVITLILIGSGATIMTNLGPLAQSLHLDCESYTILSNASQTIGRLSVTVAYIWSNRYYLTIDISLLLASIYFALFVIFATAKDNISDRFFLWFNLGFGVAYGAGWTVCANFAVYTIYPEPKHWSTVASVIYPFSGFGTLIFNYILGLIYDAQTPENGHECEGIECYRASFWFLSVCSTVLICALLALRYIAAAPSATGGGKLKMIN